MLRIERLPKHVLQGWRGVLRDVATYGATRCCMRLVEMGLARKPWFVQKVQQGECEDVWKLHDYDAIVTHLANWHVSAGVLAVLLRFGGGLWL